MVHSHRIVVVHDIPVSIVVMYHLGIHKHCYLLLAILVIVPFLFFSNHCICPIGRHYQHCLIGFLHHIKLKGNPIQNTLLCVGISNLSVGEVMDDAVSRDVRRSVMSLFDQFMGEYSTLLQLNQGI